MTDTFFFRGDTYAGLEMHAASAGLHRYARHAHDEYSVILVTHGAKLLSVERSRFTVQPGQIVVIPPGTSHECEPLKGQHWAHRCWYISPGVVADITGDDRFALSPPQVAPVLDDLVLARGLEYAHRTASNDRLMTGDAELHRLLAQAVRAASATTVEPPTINPRRLMRAQSYIDHLESGLEEALDLDLLAENGGVTRYQVIRDFNALFCMSPGRALADLRLRESKRLLRAGFAISDVSAKLGFADQSHFTRSFKGAYGTTPGKYATTSDLRPED